MSSATKWPDEVPVLDESMLRRGTAEVYEGKCCLIGHLASCGMADEKTYAVNRRVEDVLVSSLKEVGALTFDARWQSDLSYGWRIWKSNDCDSNGLSLLARAFNRAMAKLGYVVNNPECDRHGKLKPVK